MSSHRAGPGTTTPGHPVSPPHQASQDLSGRARGCTPPPDTNEDLPVSQIALRLVDDDTATQTAPVPVSHLPHGEDPNPSDLTDRALLEHYLPNADRIFVRAGGFRATLELPFEELAAQGVSTAQYTALRTAIELGRRYVEAHVHRGETLSSPNDTRRALMARLRHLEHEVFVVLFLTNRHQIISYEEMFRGTIDGATVYVREVVKRALELNAAAIVAAHNHPSGVAEPSRSDRAITKRLVEGLSLVQVRVLDHFVIGDGETVSFAERGWI